MNTFLTKYIPVFLILLLLLVFHRFVNAQTIQENPGRASVNITATARVMSRDIELITISDMGILDASRLQDDLEVYINPIFDAEAGIMRASGAANAEIRVSYLAEMEVSRREGPGSLFFVYEVSGFPGDNQRESELLTETERELRFNEDGEFYFWIGGRVNLSNAQPGNYDGEFTIEIEYM